MISQPASQAKAIAPAKTRQKPSQNVPRKFLGRLVRHGRSGPSRPSFFNTPCTAESMTKKYTCDQLGVCQSLAECHLPCSGPPEPNRFPFAPGVIDTGAEPDHQGESWSIHWVLAFLALCAIILVLGFTSGYLNLPGWLR